MGWNSEDEKSEVIERWLEGVSEGTAVVENQSVPSCRGTLHLQHLQPTHPLRTPSSTTNDNYHPKHSSKMTGKKGPQSQRETSPAAKRRAATTDRKTGSMTTKSVHFSDQETHSDDFHASIRSRSVTASTRVQRDNLSIAHPKVHFYSFESGNKPASVTELFSNLVDILENSIPNALRYAASPSLPKTGCTGLIYTFIHTERM